MYNSIKPGQPWLDTEGNRIQAHGGCMLYVDGTYYWYGENKEKTISEYELWHWGVRLYSSHDLYNWKDERPFNLDRDFSWSVYTLLAFC
jgi:hypothetical protein